MSVVVGATDNETVVAYMVFTTVKRLFGMLLSIIVTYRKRTTQTDSAQSPGYVWLRQLVAYPANAYAVRDPQMVCRHNPKHICTFLFLLPIFIPMLFFGNNRETKPPFPRFFFFVIARSMLHFVYGPRTTFSLDLRAAWYASLTLALNAS